MLCVEDLGLVLVLYFWKIVVNFKCLFCRATNTAHISFNVSCAFFIQFYLMFVLHCNKTKIHDTVLVHDEMASLWFVE